MCGVFLECVGGGVGVYFAKVGWAGMAGRGGVENVFFWGGDGMVGRGKMACGEGRTDILAEREAGKTDKKASLGKWHRV